MTARPLADSQPKKAAPHLIPPKRPCWASTASRAAPLLARAPFPTVLLRELGVPGAGDARGLRGGAGGHGFSRGGPPRPAGEQPPAGRGEFRGGAVSGGVACPSRRRCRSAPCGPSSETVSCSVTVSVSSRTRSTGTASLSTTGRSACSTTSCSSSEMAGPSRALPTLASVIGSRSIRTSSWVTGTVWVTFSVTTYLRSRARPASTCWVPTRSCSSERVIASSVVGPEVSWPTVPWRLVSVSVST